ncbi:MAG: hypothetical protein JEZ06_13880 [Anaerolineaceae bacterium]|nr:hypothetical protein [Anaerolineaceae bacterium]
MDVPFYKNPKFINRLALAVAIIAVFVLILTCSLDYYAGKLIPTATPTSTSTTYPTRKPTITSTPTITIEPTVTSTATPAPQKIILHHEDLYQGLISNGYLCRLDMNYSDTLFETTCWSETNTDQQILFLCTQDEQEIIQTIHLSEPVQETFSSSSIYELFEDQIFGLVQNLLTNPEEELDATATGEITTQPSDNIDELMVLLPEISLWLMNQDPNAIEIDEPLSFSISNMEIIVLKTNQTINLEFIFKDLNH